jgi:enamine deaminase RidA (YjgF/YER057c/UK114 family)
MQGITLTIALLSTAALAQDYRTLAPITCAEFEACLSELDQAAGPAKIVSITATLNDISDYEAMNRAYERHFPASRNDGFKPARNTLGQKGPRLTLEATLYLGNAKLEGLTPPNVKNVAPITPALRTPDRVFIAGILGRDSNSGAIPDSPAAQIDLCFSRLNRVLAEAHLAPSEFIAGKIYRTNRIPETLLRAALASQFGPHWETRLTLHTVDALALGAQVGIHGVALNVDYTKDTKSLPSIVAALYDVISGPPGPRDWQRLRHLLHPTARFQAVRPTGGLATLTVDDYIARNSKILEERGFFESETRQSVLTFEHITHVWSDFAIRRTKEGPIERRGVNSLQLFYDNQRWWILSILWDNAPTAP